MTQIELLETENTTSEISSNKKLGFKSFVDLGFRSWNVLTDVKGNSWNSS